MSKQNDTLLRGPGKILTLPRIFRIFRIFATSRTCRVTVGFKHSTTHVSCLVSYLRVTFILRCWYAIELRPRVPCKWRVALRRPQLLPPTFRSQCTFLGRQSLRSQRCGAPRAVRVPTKPAHPVLSSLNLKSPFCLYQVAKAPWIQSMSRGGLLVGPLASPPCGCSFACGARQRGRCALHAAMIRPRPWLLLASTCVTIAQFLARASKQRRIRQRLGRDTRPAFECRCRRAACTSI